MIFQLMGEELFKILTFLLSMFVLYRFSHNRKLSLVISLVIVKSIFVNTLKPFKRFLFV